MRTVFSLAAVTLVASALTTVAVADYVNNHPSSVLARCVTQVAVVCTGDVSGTRPTAAATPIISMDDQPIALELYQLSVELSAPPVDELHVISSFADDRSDDDIPPCCKTKSGVRACRTCQEDEFSVPVMPELPALRALTDDDLDNLIGGFASPGSPRSLDIPINSTSFVEDVEELTVVPQEIEVEELFVVPQQFDAVPEFEIPLPPQVFEEDEVQSRGECGTCPVAAVCQFFGHFVDGWVQCWVEGCCPVCPRATAVSGKPCCQPCQKCAPPCPVCNEVDFDTCPQLDVDLDLKNVLIIFASHDGVKNHCRAGESECCKDSKCGSVSSPAMVLKVYSVRRLVDPDVAANADAITRIISGMIEPQSWSCSGGAGHLDYYPLGMCLIVKHTPDVHVKIQELLDKLESAVSELEEGFVEEECCMPPLCCVPVPCPVVGGPRLSCPVAACQPPCPPLCVPQIAGFPVPCPVAGCHPPGCYVVRTPAPVQCDRDFASFTVEVSAKGHVEVCHQPDGTCICCEGCCIRCPSSFVKVKVVTKHVHQCQEPITAVEHVPCYDLSGDEYPPTVPDAEDVGDPFFIEIVEDAAVSFIEIIEDAAVSPVLEPTTPEDLPSCVEYPHTHHYPSHEMVCPYSGHCTRYSGCYSRSYAPAVSEWKAVQAVMQDEPDEDLVDDSWVSEWHEQDWNAHTADDCPDDCPDEVVGEDFYVPPPIDDASEDAEEGTEFEYPSETNPDVNTTEYRPTDHPPYASLYIPF